MADYSGYGMPAVDFSVLGNLGTEYKKASDQRTLADLGKRLTAGDIDYKQAAGMAAEAGRLDLGLVLLKQADEREAGQQFMQSLAGLGQPQSAPPAPQSAPPMTQPRTPMGGMQPAETSPTPDGWRPRTTYSQDEKIISAVPQGQGPNEGANIAADNFGQRFAAATNPEPQPLPASSPPPSQAPAQRVAQAPPAPVTTQNPMAGNIPLLIGAVSSPRLPQAQREVAKTLLEHALKTSDLPEAQKNYVLYSAQERATGKEPMPFLDYQKSVRAASATVINTAEGEQAAQTKARIAIDTHAVQDLSKKVATGRSALPLLQQVMELANKTPGGWAGQVSPTIARAMSGLGLEVPEKFSNAELLNSISRQFIPAVRDPGSTSNYEQQLYATAVPGLAQSQEGRVKVARMFKAQIQRNAEILQVYRQYVGRPELDQKLADLDAKPVFAPEDRKALEVVANVAKPAQGGGAATVPPAALNALKANPALREQFDAKYGAGASARELGE